MWQARFNETVSRSAAGAARRKPRERARALGVALEVTRDAAISCCAKQRTLAALHSHYSSQQLAASEPAAHPLLPTSARCTQLGGRIAHLLLLRSPAARVQLQAIAHALWLDAALVIA